MTVGAVIQRAARLAPELDKIMVGGALVRSAADPAAWRTEDVLRALHRAGLTLEADLGELGTHSVVASALQRLGADPD